VTINVLLKGDFATLLQKTTGFHKKPVVLFYRFRSRGKGDVRNQQKSALYPSKEALLPDMADGLCHRWPSRISAVEQFLPNGRRHEQNPLPMPSHYVVALLFWLFSPLNAGRTKSATQ
jgi:hypothetical protein